MTELLKQVAPLRLRFSEVVNPPAVLRRKTAKALWKGIERTSVVPPLSSILRPSQQLLDALCGYLHSCFKNRLFHVNGVGVG